MYSTILLLFGNIFAKLHCDNFLTLWDKQQREQRINASLIPYAKIRISLPLGIKMKSVDTIFTSNMTGKGFASSHTMSDCRKTVVACAQLCSFTKLKRLKSTTDNYLCSYCCRMFPRSPPVESGEKINLCANWGCVRMHMLRVLLIYFVAVIAAADAD